MIRIVEAESRHIGMLAGQMSETDRQRLSTLGRDPRRVMRSFFRGSSYRRTALYDDNPIAVWGISDPLAASAGLLWLYLSDCAKARPMMVVREAKRELNCLMITRRKLICYLHDGDLVARRFAEFFNFEIVPVSITGTGLMGYQGVLTCHS